MDADFKVSRLFNKRREDFNSLRDFNGICSFSSFVDYLEESEELIFNLVESKDVQETEQKIAQYQAENRDLISKYLGGLRPGISKGKTQRRGSWQLKY